MSVIFTVDKNIYIFEMEIVIFKEGIWSIIRFVVQVNA